MKRQPFLFGFATISFAFAFAKASDVPRDFKEKLEARYKQAKVVIVPDKVLVGIIQHIDTVCPVNYDHFHSSVSIPKSYERRNNLDERTTEQVEEGSGKMESLEPGELLHVSAIRIEKIYRFRFYGVDIFLKTLSGKRQNARGLSPTLTGNIVTKKDYGVHFRFAFAPEIIEGGDYDTVVAEINKYVMPEAEYKHGVTAAQQAQAKVDIQPGMSKEEVIKALGEPQKTVTFGKKTILKYQDLTIDLEENKVVDVKAN